jgi:hypothetical protein
MSQVKDTGFMFAQSGFSVTASNAADNISSWNVSNVTNMSYMFYAASRLGGAGMTQGYISGTFSNTANVNKMISMFDSTTVWQGRLGTWNMANVTDTSRMFSKSGFNNGYTTFQEGDLSVNAWNVSNVTDMQYMFGDPAGTTISYFDQRIPSWSVGNVTNFTGMFKGARFGGYAAQTAFKPMDIGSWNVGKGATFNEFLGETKSSGSFNTASMDLIFCGWPANATPSFPTGKTISFARIANSCTTGAACRTANWSTWTITTTTCAP